MSRCDTARASPRAVCSSSEIPYSLKFVEVLCENVTVSTSHLITVRVVQGRFP